VHACIHTCKHAHAPLYGAYGCKQRVCIDVRRRTVVVVIVVGSQMLIAYACITRVCTQTRADDIPVIRVANYICRCAAREGRRCTGGWMYTCACAHACMYVRAPTRISAPIRRIRLPRYICRTHGIYTLLAPMSPRHILRAYVRACVYMYTRASA